MSSSNPIIASAAPPLLPGDAKLSALETPIIDVDNLTLNDSGCFTIR